MITIIISRGPRRSQCIVLKELSTSLFHNTYNSSEMEFIKGTDSFQPNNKWRGVNINKLCRNDSHSLYPPVKPSSHHTVAVKLPVVPGVVPRPFKKHTDESWTKHHVHLPFSDKNVLQLEQNNVRKRWDLIQEALLRPINSSTELEEVICSYNNKKWKFPALHYLFNRELEKEETDIFFGQLLPKIIRLALRLPELLQCGIPLLNTHSNHSITLSQLQVASLLANAFLCTYPRRNSNGPDSQYANFPSINFSRLFQAQSSCVSEKLKCLINYFVRVTSKEPTGLVTYSRRYIPLSQLPRWNESKREMPEVFISSEGMIENQAGLLQVDFANKFIGGGVLGYGGVQEEIRFVICPELIAAQLFTERLNSTEALIVSGVERFNQYQGYASSFTWTGSYKDETPRDIYGRRLCSVLAIDASNVSRNPRTQYSVRAMQRELNKAYVGFSWGSEDLSRPGNTVATGNWGCGAFKGDVQLKALLQLMAAGQSGASVAYFTFGNAELTEDIYNMYKLLVEHSVGVGALFQLLSRYEACVTDRACGTLYEFLYNTIVVDKLDLFAASSAGSQTSISNYFQTTSPNRFQTESTNAFQTTPKKVDDVDVADTALTSRLSSRYCTPDKESGNKRSPSSPDLSDIFQTGQRSRHRSSLSEKNKPGGLSSKSCTSEKTSEFKTKSSSSFYASASKPRITNNTHDSADRNSSHRNCNGTNSYAVIDDLLKEAEKFEEVQQKKNEKRNINRETKASDSRETNRSPSESSRKNCCSSHTFTSRNKKDSISENFEEKSENLIGKINRIKDVSSRISTLDEDFGEKSEHDRMINGETVDHKGNLDLSNSRPSPVKISYFSNDRISSCRNISSEKKTNRSRIENDHIETLSSHSNINALNVPNSFSCSNRIKSSSKCFSNSNEPSCSKDFVIQIEEDNSIERSPSPDVINSSIADAPVKYTQDLFSEDEAMEVDTDQIDKGPINDKVVKSSVYGRELKTELSEPKFKTNFVTNEAIGKSRKIASTQQLLKCSDKIVKTLEESDKSNIRIPNEQLVRNTQDIFSEDDDDATADNNIESSNIFDTKNNNRESMARLRNDKRNNCDKSLKNAKLFIKTENNLRAHNLSESEIFDKHKTINVKSFDYPSDNEAIIKSTSNINVPHNSSTSNTFTETSLNNNIPKSSSGVQLTLREPLNMAATSLGAKSVPNDSDEVKLFKRIQRNSWADLERSRKDMKCQDIESEIQIMDTSDELRPNDSPKIRKTNRMNNKKITDYFSREIKK